MVTRTPFWRLLAAIPFLVLFFAEPVACQEARGTSVRDESTRFDYSRSHSFPRGFYPYTVPSLPGPRLANSSRLQDLIVGGKLTLTLDDAIALALKIRIARNDVKYSGSVFRQNVITALAVVMTSYYELLADQESIRMAQGGLEYAQQSRDQLEADQKLVTLARQVLEMLRQRSTLASVAVEGVITAQENVAIAQGHVVKARATYAKALIEYEQATGTLLERHNIEMSESVNAEVYGVPIK